MRRQTGILGKVLMFLFLAGVGCHGLWSQPNDQAPSDDSAATLFGSDEPFSIWLSYSETDLAEKSNDSTYIPAELSYVGTGDLRQTLPAEVRVRGGFRRTYCHYTPLKLKIGKQQAEGTPFEGNRKMKLVLPCLKSKKADDNLLKELMAYKIYETLSSYHFKTRLLEIELVETGNGKITTHRLLGFAIQDDESFAQENDAKEIERFINFDAQDEELRVTNALFQFMIGNTDFSTVYLHNEKLFYVDEKIVPVPYDFDMSGLVDASYAVVSEVQNEVLPITHVTNRLYRGFTADEKTLQAVRQEFLKKKEEVFQKIDGLEPHFKDSREFDKARKYIEGFYEVLEDDKKFRRRIAEKGREK